MANLIKLTNVSQRWAKKLAISPATLAKPQSKLAEYHCKMAEEPLETGTVGTVFPGTERRTGTVGTHKHQTVKSRLLHLLKNGHLIRKA